MLSFSLYFAVAATRVLQVGATTLPPVMTQSVTAVCETTNERTSSPATSAELTDLGVEALLASLALSSAQALSWGQRGAHSARMVLYHRATQSRYLPAGWEEYIEAGVILSEEDEKPTERIDEDTTATSTPTISLDPTPKSDSTTESDSTTAGVNTSDQSSSTQASEASTTSSSSMHNVAEDGFEFPADRPDRRRAVYRGPNGLNRSVNGWRQYWTDPRDQEELWSDFLNWAKQAADEENSWLQKYYSDAIGHRIQRNTSGAQNFERTVRSKTAKRETYSGITYMGKKYSAESVLRAKLRVSAEVAKGLVGAAPRRRLQQADDTNDDWLPSITLSFTPPVWSSSSKTDPPKHRGAPVVVSKRWDSVPIFQSAKDVDQVLENVVAIQDRPFYGVQRSDRDYFGKAEEENLMRPWDRLWSAKKIYTIYG